MTLNNDYRPSSVPLDTRIAADKTVAEWLELRAGLISDPSDTNAWNEAYDFFRLRIDTRFIKPIERILEINENLGEGHSASALQCILVEFLGALFQGKIYRTRSPQNAIEAHAKRLSITYDKLKDHSQPHEYSSSASVFKSFLTNQIPFSSFFGASEADAFFRDIRCGLLHEAATKHASVVRTKKNENVDCVMERTKDGIVIYRNAFQRALSNWIEGYRRILLSDREIQQNFLRKMDDIAQIRRCFYFAYGSNMHQSRLLSRISHVHGFRSAKLDGYLFCYNKKSNDGTAKANIFSCPGETVWGVCYEIDEHDFRGLKSFEKGYDPMEVWIEDEEGKGIIAITYVSKSITTTSPSAEYVERVVTAASDHHLPENYIKQYLQQQ